MPLNIRSSGRSPPAARRAARWPFVGTASLAGVLCAGCNSLGPRQIPLDRFDYSAAIADSANQQMLLNLVRLHHGEVPTFLAVNSVLTQYAWAADVGVAGSSGDNLGFPSWSVGGSGNARYIERPTVTYSPLSGQEFATQLLNPVRADVVFSLVSSGWPPRELLSTTIHRINDVRNTGFAEATGAVADRPAEFVRAIDLIIELARRDSVELVRGSGSDADLLLLEFPESPSADAAPFVREFKELVGLDPETSRFRVTRRVVGREPDQVTIRMHSLLELMGLLSRGVEPAPAEGDAESVAPPPAPSTPGLPLTIRASAEPPVDALVAVEYAGSWYFIPRSDEESKRAFGLLIYIFQMQASQPQGAGPLLTVPVN